MDYEITLTMKGDFPSGKDTIRRKLNEKQYDAIVSIMKRWGKLKD